MYKAQFSLPALHLAIARAKCLQVDFVPQQPSQQQFQQPVPVMQQPQAGGVQMLSAAASDHRIRLDEQGGLGLHITWGVDEIHAQISK